MLRYLLRRLLGAFAILLVVVGVTYFLFFAAPRDPARLACGTVCPETTLNQIRHGMGLDQPVYEQFWIYLSGLFAGRTIGAKSCEAPCLGYSYFKHEPVLDILAQKFPATVSLVVGAAVFFLLLGVGAGLLAAARRGTRTDRLVSGFALIGAAVQIYFIGLVAQYFLVDKYKILDRPGYTSLFEDPGAWAGGLLLAWLVLAIVYTASYARYSRASMIEALNEDAVRTARAKGLAGRVVFFKYAGRAAVTPIVTLFGLDLGHLLGGAMITETTFNIPGIGKAAVDAVTQNDLPIMMGVTLIAATLMVLFTLIVDLLYAVIDPRVRIA
ncbi:ABC transporter permease [Streptomyces sp. NBC_00620]|uniref:ABC transporter permease n=1 Tax=Streptomyces sp. NBC_00620 TaxID=2903666 RepID=UPI00225A6A56|nr:ABC transporter permease [Streptomyces sp. NBC_00620]MCX4978350.1 ABC transporter permease [Streptomyces sp. NBC_00620]